MKKNYLVLLCLLFSTAAFAGNNIFCENKDTASEECVKVSKQIYGARAKHLAQAYVQKKEKEGKTVDKKRALRGATRSQPVSVFRELFTTCGENSETLDKAKVCLEQGLQKHTQNNRGKKAPQKK